MSRKQFHQVLGDIRQGELNEELTAKLTELVAAVQDTGKAGSLVLKITLTPTKGLALEIDDDVKLQKPTKPKATTILFPTVEGNLQVNNPMQRQLPLQSVQDGGTHSLTVLVDPQAKKPLQEVPGTTATPTGTAG